MSSRFTKKSLVSASGCFVKTPCFAAAGVGAEHAQAADQHRHLGRGQREQLRPIEQQRLGGDRVAALLVVAEAVGDRLEHRERLDVGLLLRGVRAPGRERHLSRSWPAFFAACSTPAQPPSTIRSASDTCLPPAADLLNSAWMPSSVFEHLRELRRLD